MELRLRNDVPGLIRLCTAKDRPRLMALYSQTWGHQFAELMERIHRWKYEEHPWGEGLPRSLVLEADGEVAGFMGVIPARFKVGGRTVEGCWLTDVMVAPVARGPGGPSLVTAIQQREPLTLGASGTGLRRFWRRATRQTGVLVANLSRVRRRFGLKGAALRTAGGASQISAILGARPDTGDIMVEAGSFPREEGWMAPILATFDNVPLRGEDYLRWRYDRCPYGAHGIFVAYRRGHGPQGYLVLREDRKDVALIVDTLAGKEDDAVAYALIEAALRRARAIGKEIVETLEPRAGALMRSLHLHGFLPPMRRQSEFTIVASTTIQDLTEQLYHNGSSWYFTLGDSDTDMRT